MNIKHVEHIGIAMPSEEESLQLEDSFLGGSLIQ